MLVFELTFEFYSWFYYTLIFLEPECCELELFS